MSDDLIDRLRHPLASALCLEAADEIERLRVERQHSLGCEHHEDPPHRCTVGVCYRQWQADEIERLRDLIDTTDLPGGALRAAARPQPVGAWAMRVAELEAEIERLRIHIKWLTR